MTYDAHPAPTSVPTTRRRHGVSALTIGLGLVLALVLAGCDTSGSTSGSTHPVKAKPAMRTFLGPDGVVSSSAIAENRHPGTTAWEIPPHSGPDGIEGFANLNYAAAGDQVTLYVSTAAPQLHVIAYRMAARCGSRPWCPARSSPPARSRRGSTWCRVTTGRPPSRFRSRPPSCRATTC